MAPGMNGKPRRCFTTKKVLCVLLAVLLAVGMAACARKAVSFADPVLEAMVRGAMGKPKGSITVAEAEAVTRLSVGIEWQQDDPEAARIKDISGLESFKNLEVLDLSCHAITDITPIVGLKNLTAILLEGNPIADTAPLAGLTNLEVLTLSGCAAQDYSPLANLVNLNFLMLDHASVTDVSPLAGLTSLKHLYLAGSPIDDYSPLTDIYPNLEEKDFIMASTLAELGFVMSDAGNQADYRGEKMSLSINHSEWGTPSFELSNCVKMYLQLDSGYMLIVMYYPKIDAYVFQMFINHEMTMNYVYDVAGGRVTLSSSERESAERVITAALGETDAEDILLAPIPIFNETIKNTFGMTVDALYALPF